MDPMDLPLNFYSIRTLIILDSIPIFYSTRAQFLTRSGPKFYSTQFQILPDSNVFFRPSRPAVMYSNLPNWENQKHNRFFTTSNHSLMELILLILTKMSVFLSFCPTIEILYKDVNMFWHHLGHCRHAPD